MNGHVLKINHILGTAEWRFFWDRFSLQSMFVSLEAIAIESISMVLNQNNGCQRPVQCKNVRKNSLGWVVLNSVFLFRVLPTRFRPTSHYLLTNLSIYTY